MAIYSRNKKITNIKECERKDNYSTGNRVIITNLIRNSRY